MSANKRSTQPVVVPLASEQLAASRSLDTQTASTGSVTLGGLKLGLHTQAFIDAIMAALRDDAK